MIHLFFVVITLCLFAVSAAWFADHPGHVTIHWQGYEISTTLGIFLLGSAGCAFGIFCIVEASYFLLTLRKRLSQGHTIKRQNYGLSIITRGFAALAMGDVKSAERYTLKAQKLLGRTPITLLLSAQLARQEGDGRRAKLYLEEMLPYPETQGVAARGLIEDARRSGRLKEAILTCEHVQKENKKDAWTATTLIDLYIRENRWQEALHRIDKALSGNTITRGTAKRWRGLVYYAQARRAAHTPALAMASATKARACLSAHPPAIALLAEMEAKADAPEKAVKTLLKGWKEIPHPSLCSIYFSLFTHEPDAKRLHRALKLAHMHPDHPESHYVKAEGYIMGKAWQDAKTLLETLVRHEESARACRLMARVEKEGFYNTEAMSKWLERALTANPDSVWHCMACGHESSEWHVHCPSCETMDRMEWKTRQKIFIDSDGDRVFSL